MKATDIRKLLCLLVFSQGFLMVVPSFAQSNDELTETRDDRYAQIEDGFIENCMTQEMPPALSGVRISNSVRTNYCSCLFDYYQSNFTFEEYAEISRAFVENPLSLMSQPETLISLQRGFEGCYEYAIQADSSITQDDILTVEVVENIEQQVAALRSQGQLKEAASIAEEAISKKKA